MSNILQILLEAGILLFGRYVNFSYDKDISMLLCSKSF